MFASAQLADQDESNSVREIKLWFPEQSPNCPILMLILADFSVLLYQSLAEFDEKAHEKFRFKLVDSHVLIKPKIVPQGPTSSATTDQYSREYIFVEGKMALILHPSRPFGVFIRNGKPICIDLGKQQGSSYVSMTPFMTGFLALKQVQSASKLILFRFPPRFDPRNISVNLTDGYLLKQFVFTDRGIKKLKIFSPTAATVNNQAQQQ